ncbi:MAG: SDR family NAD(P)-dependent oxidoreductase, partial [Sphingobacteriia bacterium]|nr:SDR family NAD(P)-dependent oxidoreductase [Sphingobacteriia bacterium]
MTASLALITGGAQGIGRALAQSFLDEGWRVVVLDRDAEAIDDLTADPGSPALLGLVTDVAEETAVAAAFAALEAWQDRAGEPAGLNLLVNNAGLADPVSGPLEALSLAGWRRWLDGHLTGAFLCTRSAIPG